jgi:hypothetical protein
MQIRHLRVAAVRHFVVFERVYARLSMTPVNGAAKSDAASLCRLLAGFRDTDLQRNSRFRRRASLRSRELVRPRAGARQRSAVNNEILLKKLRT